VSAPAASAPAASAPEVAAPAAIEAPPAPQEVLASVEVVAVAVVAEPAPSAEAPATPEPTAPPEAASPEPATEPAREERRSPPPARDHERRGDRGERSFEAPRAERSFEAPRAERSFEAPRAERPASAPARPEGRRQRGSGYRRPEGEDEPIRYSVSDAEPIRYSVSDAEPRGGEQAARPTTPERMERPSDLVNWHPTEEEGDDRPIFVSPGGNARRRPIPAPPAVAAPPVIAAPPEARRSEGSEEPLFDDNNDREDGEGYATVYVDIGRREGARPADLQRVLRDRGGITRRETGRIRMRDRYALVSVRRELLPRAIEALSGAEIGGKLLKAEPAREREAEGD
jgi:ATP-dependent RNA helicase DeaD